MPQDPPTTDESHLAKRASHHDTSNRTLSALKHGFAGGFANDVEGRLLNLVNCSGRPGASSNAQYINPRNLRETMSKLGAFFGETRMTSKIHGSLGCLRFHWNLRNSRIHT